MSHWIFRTTAAKRRKPPLLMSWIKTLVDQIVSNHDEPNRLTFKFNPGRLTSSQFWHLRSYHTNYATPFFRSARKYEAKIAVPVRTKYRVTCFQQCSTVANNRKCCLPYRYGPYVTTCSTSLFKIQYFISQIRMLLSRLSLFRLFHSFHFYFTTSILLSPGKLMASWLVNSYGRFKREYCLRLQDCLTLKMKAGRSLEKTANIYQSTPRPIIP